MDTFLYPLNPQTAEATDMGDGALGEVRGGRAEAVKMEPETIAHGQW